MYLLAFHPKAFQDLVDVNFLDRLLALLTESQVAEKDGSIKREGIHVFTGSSVDFTRAGQDSALSLRFRRGNNEGYTHKLQQSLALGIVLTGNANRSSGKLLNVLGSTRLLGLLQVLVGLLLPLETLGELTRLELRRGTVEDVERLDAVVYHTQSAVEETHEM